MTFSATITDRRQDLHARIAGALSGAQVTAVAPVGRGGNNRVYRVATNAGVFALKAYPSLVEDSRDRLGVEMAALHFLAQHGIACVPRALAADPERGFALYEWIPGSSVTKPTPGDFDAALEFVGSLRALGQVPAAQMLAPASEACLSAVELAAQIERRFDRLAVVADKESLRRFLEGALWPFYAAALGRAREGYIARGWDFAANIPVVARTLSPSDFGFHNALRHDDGGLVFLDFEYFGWDDPVRVVADFLLHPGMTLDAAQRRCFAAGASAIFAGDPAFAARLKILYPLVGVRWCLILLNEFLPERWARRAFAGAGDPAKARVRQLVKARALLETLAEGDGSLPP